MTNEIKVAECWTISEDDGRPDWADCHEAGIWEDSRRAILLWREDYDAMRKELEELRAEKRLRKESPARYGALLRWVE